MPSIVTAEPTIGLVRPLPWMSWMRVAGAPHTSASAVWKLKTKSAAIVLGGSFASWSSTFAATTVTVHDSLGAKFASRSSVKTVGPPAVGAVCPRDTPQVIENHPTATLTGSENVTLMLESSATPLAPAIGLVAVMLGATSAVQMLKADAVLRGAGVPAAKSAPLLSVSAQPPLFRRSAVVFVRAGAAAPSSKLFAVVP